MRQSLREAALLLLLTVAAAAATQWLHPRAPAWQATEESLPTDEVTADQVGERWKGEVLWIDARPRTQFAKGHIPGAINLSEAELEAQLIENIQVLQDNRKPVVVYCDGGACRASHLVRTYLAERLPSMEFFILRGGWPAWQARAQR